MKDPKILEGVGLTINFNKNSEIRILYKNKLLFKFYSKYKNMNILALYLMSTIKYMKPEPNYRLVYSKKKNAYYLINSDENLWAAKVYDINIAYQLINQLNLKG